MIDPSPSRSWFFYVLCYSAVGKSAPLGCCIRVEWQSLIFLCFVAQRCSGLPLGHWLNMVRVKEASQHHGESPAALCFWLPRVESSSTSSMG